MRVRWRVARIGDCEVFVWGVGCAYNPLGVRFHGCVWP